MINKDIIDMEVKVAMEIEVVDLVRQKVNDKIVKNLEEILVLLKEK